ncbi:hypothetical protein YC2023_075624 [Brassica napus]
MVKEERVFIQKRGCGCQGIFMYRFHSLFFPTALRLLEPQGNRKHPCLVKKPSSPRKKATDEITPLSACFDGALSSVSKRSSVSLHAPSSRKRGVKEKVAAYELHRSYGEDDSLIDFITASKRTRSMTMAIDGD